jgi:hypothetical protein
MIQRCSVVSEVLPAHKSQTSSSSASRQATIKSQFECIYCKVLFRNKSHAFRHAAKDHKDIVVKCHPCKLCFFSRAELNRHGRKFHNLNLRCVYCKDGKRIFIKRYLLRHHIKIHHKAYEIIQCSDAKCKKFFKTETELSEHKKDVHKSKADTIECKECKMIVLLPHINMHMRQFHSRSRSADGQGKETTCCYCQENLPSKGATMRHVKEFHSNIETFNCYTCTLYFPNLEQKQNHNQEVHRGDFKCIYCINWSCAYLSNLRRHLREKHKGEVFQCKYNNMCALYFKTQDDLQKHVLESHECDKTNKSQCVYCEKFMEHRHIASHVNYNHKSVAIKCNFNMHCARYFLTKEHLDKHILEDHYYGKVVDNLKCAHCNNVYGTFTNLRNHTFKIHGVTLLKCSERNCKFICNSSEMLVQHSQDQHGVAERLKIFNCKLCNYRAKYAGYIEKHILFKHGTENKKCPLCSKKKFKSDFALNYHLKNAHPKESKICMHCKLPVHIWHIHVKQRRCKFCNISFPCSVLKKKHSLICKG